MTTRAMVSSFQPGDALFLVDMQNDFFSGGALAVPQGDEIIPSVNQWVALAQAQHIPIIASRDWHPVDHCSFKQQGGIWPPHCMANTKGAAFHSAIEIPTDTIIVNKGELVDREAYSAFVGVVVKEDKQPQKFADWLQHQAIQRFYVVGLALDYCVKATALDLCEAGYSVVVLLDGTRAITAETGKAACQEMMAAGVRVQE